MASSTFHSLCSQLEVLFTLVHLTRNSEKRTELWLCAGFRCLSVHLDKALVLGEVNSQCVLAFKEWVTKISSFCAGSKTIETTWHCGAFSQAEVRTWSYKLQETPKTKHRRQMLTSGSQPSLRLIESLNKKMTWKQNCSLAWCLYNWDEHQRLNYGKRAQTSTSFTAEVTVIGIRFVLTADQCWIDFTQIEARAYLCLWRFSLRWCSNENVRVAWWKFPVENCKSSNKSCRIGRSSHMKRWNVAESQMKWKSLNQWV